MKKFLIMMTFACMLLTLAACGAGGGDVQNGENNTNAPTISAQDNFRFVYNGTEITLHAPAEPVVAALGEPVKYSESTSCAFEGLDKSYYYGSFYLETYPVNDKDFIYGWWFADDSVTTEEGIYIGSSQADVEAAYGAENFNGTNAFIVNKAAGSLTIILTDGVVSSIQYAMKAN